jgi:hypothetical protein
MLLDELLTTEGLKPMLVLSARKGRQFKIEGNCTITVLGNDRYGFDGPGRVVRAEIEREPEPDEPTDIIDDGGPTL